MPRDRSMTDGCKPSTSMDAPSTSAPQRRATATGIPASPPPVPDPVDTERRSSTKSLDKMRSFFTAATKSMSPTSASFKRALSPRAPSPPGESSLAEHHDKGRFVASSSEEDLAQQCTENLEIERVASVEC